MKIFYHLPAHILVVYQNIYFFSEKTHAHTRKKKKNLKKKREKQKKPKKHNTGPVNGNHVMSSQMRNKTPLQL